MKRWQQDVAFYCGLAVLLAGGLWVGWRYGPPGYTRRNDARLAMLESRITQVESNAVETLAAARLVRADLAVLERELLSVLKLRWNVTTNWTVTNAPLAAPGAAGNRAEVP